MPVATRVARATHTMTRADPRKRFLVVIPMVTWVRRVVRELAVAAIETPAGCCPPKTRGDDFSYLPSRRPREGKKGVVGRSRLGGTGCALGGRAQARADLSARTDPEARRGQKRSERDGTSRHERTSARFRDFLASTKLVPGLFQHFFHKSVDKTSTFGQTFHVPRSGRGVARPRTDRAPRLPPN